MELTVERMNDYNFKVTNKEIDVEVWYIDRWVNKVKGKGSRKFKNMIIDAVAMYILEEEHNRRIKKEQEIIEKRNRLLRSDKYKNINLLRLYKATIEYYDAYHKHFVKLQVLKTGYEIIQSDRVVNFEDHYIKNTDIYCIGHVRDYLYHLKTDKRLFNVGVYVYVTGLAIKELIHEGWRSNGNFRLVKDETELRSIKQYGDDNREVHVLFDITSIDKQKEMKQRYLNELQRAGNGNFEIKKEYTSDGREIKKAWFSSKPSNINEVLNLLIASYDNYIIDQSIKVDKDVFDQFKNSFNLNILPLEKPFKGGIYQNSDKFCRKVLEVKCNDYDYTLLIDSQGYDYGRYVAINKINKKLCDY